MQKYYLILAGVLWLSASAIAQTDNTIQVIDSLTNTKSFVITDPREVLKYDNELISVEGCIVRASLKDQIKGKPIFMDMFVPYPDNVLTMAIWEEHQSKFLPAADYQQKKVRVTGKAKKKVYNRDGKAPQERVTISLYDPKQITILGDCER
ncbi:MAG: hypothetical protein ACOYLC_15810 [Armatimonadaceae bacterium]